MKLISWNMNRRPENWRVLAELIAEHGATGAMVQEAPKPLDIPASLKILGDPSLGSDPWHMPVPPGPKRNFASAVAVRTDVQAGEWKPRPLAEAEYSKPVISHPGQWVAIKIEEPGDVVWIVSLYGLWETMEDTRDIFAEATLHRALSDLTLLFQARDTARIVVAGDLNIWRGYGKKKWMPRYDTVFQRLEAYGLELAGPRRADDRHLDGCPCGGGAECTHVQTYRHQHKKASTPYQTDFVFSKGVKVAECRALDDERYWQHSDHCPVLIEVEPCSA